MRLEFLQMDVSLTKSNSKMEFPLSDYFLKK